jgi:hypothetical protein
VGDDVVRRGQRETPVRTERHGRDSVESPGSGGASPYRRRGFPLCLLGGPSGESGPGTADAENPGEKDDK